MLTHEQTQILEQAITLLFTLRNEQAEERREVIRSRELGRSLSNGVRDDKPLIEVIKDMLIELKIEGSVRQRANGLIEFRSTVFGSTYGRSEVEIREKLQEKIKNYKKAKRTITTHTGCPLLSEFFRDNYYPHKLNQGRRKSTLKGIEYNFNKVVKMKFDKRLNTYTAQDIENFLYSLGQTRKRQIMQGFLNNLFNRAVCMGVIKVNPCTPVEKMKYATNAGTAFSFTEQKQFFNALYSSKANDVLKCYYTYVYLTGTRRNEALALKANHLNLDEGTLFVDGTKTTGSMRHIPLFGLVKKLLATMTPNAEGFFFPISDRTADKEHNKLVNKLGLKHKLHDLRHTFGTIQIVCNKLDVKTVSLWIGHSTIETTLKIYTHPEHLDRATFLNGELSEAQKEQIYKTKYHEVLSIIETFLHDRTQIVPKK